MFTGIIEETGKIQAINHNSIEIVCEKVLTDTKIGDSIAVNGVCLTVSKLGKNFFTADVSPETFKVTAFGRLKTGMGVNLERALGVNDLVGNAGLQAAKSFEKGVNEMAGKLDLQAGKNCINTRLGGHIVSGHVDGTAKISSITNNKEFYNLEIELSDDEARYVIKKGSITVNGISLTIAEAQGSRIKIAVIPHTYESTNLSELRTGDYVNIECDIIAKYVEKFLSTRDNKSSVDMDFLQRNGFC